MMIPKDTSDVGFDEYLIETFDGFGHWVQAGRYGTELGAQTAYDGLLKTNVKYPEIRMLKVLAAAERS